jgi:hypothetical protein
VRVGDGGFRAGVLAVTRKPCLSSPRQRRRYGTGWKLVGERYAREPIQVDVCADCGAYVADRQVHNEWHQSHPPRHEPLLGERTETSYGFATGYPGLGSAGWPMGPPAEAEEFGHLLFTVAREHLDPDGRRLEWSEGFTGSFGSTAVREWGRKFEWSEPDDSGQAMVYVAVGNTPRPDRLPCGQYDNPGASDCHSHTMPDHSQAEVLLNPDRLELHWPRPDGSYVFAIVDATFRNNSLTPSKAALPRLQQLEAFVMDPRLVLP